MSSSPIADEQVSAENANLKATRTIENNFTALNVYAEDKESALLYIMKFNIEEPFELSLSEIEFVEEESVLDLGFDTTDYLPEGFNPYESFFASNENFLL